MKRLPIIAEAPSELSDAQDRKISYLRVSVTDRCNYACTYCVPERGVPMVRRERLLTFEEITRLISLMAEMGVRRVRLTGGEPTIRKGVVSLVESISAINGIEEVAMTTNAHLMGTMAAPLAKAGLASVNVSLDTLKPGAFAELTRRGDIEKVIRGIEACVAAGMRVSTNTVALRGLNEREVVSLCEFAWERGISPRFIEHMPMSGGAAYSERNKFTSVEIRDVLAQHYGTEPVAEGSDGGRGPARYWSVEGGGRVGIISAMSEHFCSTCNRLRLSATGNLHTCLAHDDALDLKSILRGVPAGGEEIQHAIRAALSLKKEGHEFDPSGRGGPAKHMISIGG
ncbi:MAG: GTP 3',8-cyclase MoaA [Myxococcales bacterium]|nr:GTP 3',8-cyclase MoaA [Myxococcales bacterium]